MKWHILKKNYLIYVFSLLLVFSGKTYASGPILNATILGFGFTLEGTFSSEKSFAGLSANGIYGKLGLFNYGVTIEAGYRTTDSIRGRIGIYAGIFLFNLEAGFNGVYSLGGNEKVSEIGYYVGGLIFVPLGISSEKWNYFLTLSGGVNSYKNNINRYPEGYKEYYFRLGIMFLWKNKSEYSQRENY